MLSMAVSSCSSVVKPLSVVRVRVSKVDAVSRWLTLTLTLTLNLTLTLTLSKLDAFSLRSSRSAISNTCGSWSKHQVRVTVRIRVRVRVRVRVRLSFQP